MRSPRPPTPGQAAHASHDELLVARLAGHDTLDPDEHAAASALVASCPDCALLAADIAAITRAVASETVPPRRRDYRIGAEQARALRGSRLDRLLRRLAPPSGGGALRPLAAGALSIGLVLVFVGSVVPRPTDIGQGPPAAAPVLRSSPPSAAQKLGEPPASHPERSGSDTSSAEEAMTLEVAAPAQARQSPGAAGMTDTGADGAAPEAAALEAAEPEAATREAPDRVQRSDTSGFGSDASAAAAFASEAPTRTPSGSEAPAPAALASEAPALSVGADALTDDGAIDTAARLPTDGVDDETTAQVAPPQVDADATPNDGGPGTILVVVGLVLILVGVAAALLLLMGRRPIVRS